MTRKPAFAHFGEHGKISISHTNLLSIQNEAIWPLFAMHSKELWLVQENHATVKLESKITYCGLKTNSKSRIELCNQQIFKKNAGKSLCSEKLQLQSTLEAIQFKFWMKGALVRVKICVLCDWWFSNQFDNSVGDTL